MEMLTMLDVNEIGKSIETRMTFKHTWTECFLLRKIKIDNLNLNLLITSIYKSSGKSHVWYAIAQLKSGSTNWFSIYEQLAYNFSISINDAISDWGKGMNYSTIPYN